MKVYVAVRFKGLENKTEVEELCKAVRASGMDDFCFVRDIENYQKVFNSPQKLWQRAVIEIKQCDALLIDVSDSPTGGRVVEAGIAYGLGLPVFVAVKEGLEYKGLYNGIAERVIVYNTYSNISDSLADYLTSR